MNSTCRHPKLRSEWRGAAWLTWLQCLLVVGTVPAVNRAGDHLINLWSAEDGLKSSSVTAIAQTFDGYLWVGTYNGLARFDGVEFVVFDPANTPELRHARVRRLQVDATGVLWIALHDGSLTAWRQGQFTLEWEGSGGMDMAPTPIPARQGTPKFLLNNGQILVRGGGSNGVEWTTFTPPGASSGQIAVEDWDGVVWTRGRDQVLWRFKDGEFEAVPPDALLGSTIHALSLDRYGRLWLGSDRGLGLWNGQRFEDLTPTNAEPVVSVQKICLLRNGDLWLLANDRLRRVRGREWVAEAEACRGPFVSWENRLGLHEDARGSVWLYHYGRGLFHVQEDGTTRRFGGDDSFPGRRVDCFFEDREGNLWAGVDRGGLVRLRERQFSLLAPESLADGRTAVTVTEDATGGIWIGTYGAGLHHWTGNTWRKYFDPEHAERGYVFSVVADGQGQVWASAGEEDLFVRRGDNFEQYAPLVHGVKALLPASDGTLWIGMKAGLGLIQSNTFRLFWPTEGVPRLEMRALAEDQQGQIWVGGGDGILYRVRNFRGEAIPAPAARSAQPIWSLLADADGTIWAGTFRGGLLRYAEGRFTRITTEHGLPDNVICQLLEDDLGNLWVGSQQGIFRVPKAELHALAAGRQRTVTCIAYGRYDGLPSLEFSGSYQPAAWRTRAGNLLFASHKGVVMVEPGAVAPQRLSPPVVVEAVTVDGENLPYAATPLRALPAHEPPPVQIRSGKRQVEFRYAGVSLVAPDRVRFRHRLRGLDEDWIEAGTQRVARYNYLRPGDYTFEVSACNSDGVWTVRPATVAIRVLPRFYETGWFIVLCVVGAVGAVAGTVRHWSVRRMRQELERLERQRAIERDRTRIAKDIHDDLGAGLTHIALLSEMARPAAAPELQTQLGQITEVARELTSNMDEIVWAVNPENDTLDSLVTYLTKFAQDYLNVAGIRCRLDLPAQLPAAVLPAEVRHNLFLAIKEALNNVVQHAQATEVWLRLQLQSGSFTVSLEDNGRGLPAPGSSSGTRPGRVSSGHGLMNLQNRLTGADGHCEVSSAPGQGTTVKLTVPWPGRSPELASSLSQPTQ